MNKILNWFIENIGIDEPIIIFGSSAMHLHDLSDEFGDVDLALTKEWMQSLYKKILNNNHINIDWKEEQIKWIKMWNINTNNFWESIKIRFNISWLDFEWFVEKKEKNSLFWKYFKDLDKYTTSVWPSNVKLLKPKYLTEAYIKITSNELEYFNKTQETLDSQFKLEPGTNINELNNFLDKNWEVFDKKILKIFKRKENISKITNLNIK